MVLFGFVFLCICWSTTWYAIRLCLTGYPPLSGATLRFLLAALLMAGLCRLVRSARESRCSRRDHLGLCLAGVANGLGYACIYLAEQTISGGTAAVISASSPFFTVLIARLCGLELFVPRRLVGVLIGFLGVTVMMADSGERSSDHLKAVMMVAFSAAVLWPIYGALLKRHAQGLNPLRSCMYLLGYTALTLAVLSLISREPPPLLGAPPKAYLGLLYLAVVGSVFAWTIFLWLLKRLDLTVLSTLSLIQPVLALLLDRLVGDSQLRPHGYLGAAMVVFGVALAALHTQRRTRTQVLRDAGAVEGAVSGPVGSAMAGPVACRPPSLET